MNAQWQQDYVSFKMTIKIKQECGIRALNHKHSKDLAGKTNWKILVFLTEDKVNWIFTMQLHQMQEKSTN